MGKTLRADTSPPLPLKFTFTYFFSSCTVSTAMNCTCIVLAALGSFISRDETALLREEQVALQLPLGSSALCLERKERTASNLVRVGRLEPGRTTETIFSPFTTTGF